MEYIIIAEDDGIVLEHVILPFDTILVDHTITTEADLLEYVEAFDGTERRIVAVYAVNGPVRTIFVDDAVTVIPTNA